MAEPEAPRTRGFLFADLRGYTRFVETHGDRAASELLSAYRMLVRTAVAKFSGAEIRTEGDGFYVVFPSASSSIRCGLAILEEAAASTAGAGGPLAVGIGIHAGETEDSAEGFVGSAVNIAARVCALAGSGELLVTETVRGLVRTSMPLTMEPRGRRHLKGIREPIGLFAIRPTGAAPTSRSRRLRSVAARSLERRPVVAGFAALAGVAAVATVVVATGMLAGVNARPGSGSGLRPASTTSPSPTSPPSLFGPFPNAAEQSLLGRIDPAIGPLCGRAPTSDIPRTGTRQPGTAGPLEQMGIHAGLRCALGGSAPDLLFVWDTAVSFTDSGQGDDFIRQRVSEASLEPGDCSTDDTALMEWSFGGLHGKLVCVAGGGRARFDWTFDGRELLVTAWRNDGDGAALYRWWLTEGRGLVH